MVLPTDQTELAGPVYGIPNLWDGATRYSLYTSSNSSSLPQWITIDLGKKVLLSRFKQYMERVDHCYTGSGLKTFELWGSNSPDLDGGWTQVKYTDVNGNIKIRSFPTNLPTSEITDIKPRTSYQFRTMFKPDSLSIDDFYTSYSESGPFNFDKKDWKVIDYSDQYSEGENAAKNVIDGTDATRWHTNGSAYPHYVTVDMGVVRTITQCSVWRTVFDNPNGDDRAPTRIQFLLSMDNQNWTSLGDST